MSWEPEIEELKRRVALAHGLGGTEKVARQKAAGRLTVRERIDGLVDGGSFHETGAISGAATYDENGKLVDFRPANCVFGKARLDDRPVVVVGDDFTVRGGANDAGIRGKQLAAEQLAFEYRLPLVRLIEGTGGGGSVKTLEQDGATYIPGNPAWDWVVANMGQVPVISLALGPVAGLGAARAVTSHYSVMVKDLSQMFVAGLPVVAGVGEDLDKEGLGGSKIHTRNGAIDDEVESEEAAFAKAKQFLSYLPQSVHELAPRGPLTDDPNRRDDWLIGRAARRRKVYKMRPIIESVVDQAVSWNLPLQWPLGDYRAGPSGWLAGGDHGRRPVRHGGAWTADASQKITRFVDLAETFHLPVVHLVDCPGFLIGSASEQAATIRHGARALAAVYQARTPWCSILIRKVFGVAGAGNANAARYHYRYAWPSGDWGSLPVEGGLEAAYKSDLAAAEDPEALKADILARLEAVRSPFRTAERFVAEEIIDPRDTRPLLCEWANLAAPLRTAGPVGFPMRP